MKLIDKYIIRNFLGTFLFTILLFAGIIFVINLSEKIDDFMENAAPLNEIVFKYYLNYIPYLIFQLFPLFVFISVIFFTSRLAGRTEIIAMMSGGVSFYRILLVPYLVAASFLFVLQYWGNHYWVPNFNKEWIDFESEYIKKRNNKKESHVQMQIDPTHFVYMSSYSKKDSTAKNFSYEEIENEELKYKIKSKKIRWNNKTNQWAISNFTERKIDGLHESVRSGTKLDTALGFTPIDIGENIHLSEAMTSPELVDHIAKQRKKGATKIEFFEVERHRRTAIPFATFILTAIGFGIASRKVRGGIGLHIFAGVALSAAYIFLLKITATFATNAGFSPLIAVWMPNVLFLLIGIYILRVAPK